MTELFFNSDNEAKQYLQDNYPQLVFDVKDVKTSQLYTTLDSFGQNGITFLPAGKVVMNPNANWFRISYDKLPLEFYFIDEETRILFKLMI